MQTKALYYENGYLSRFSAQVLSCVEAEGRWAVTLDATAFYPEGGGQPSDLGTIDGYPVCHVREIGHTVYHQIDLAAAAASGLEAPASYFTAGRTVHCEIDWDRRFDNMQRHCGEHILSGMFFREYGGIFRECCDGATSKGGSGNRKMEVIDSAVAFCYSTVQS